MDAARACLLLALIACSRGAAGSPLSAINEARASVCMHSHATTPLSESALLDRAAEQLAHGRTLHEVLNSLPARPAFAAAVRLNGGNSDYAISRGAAARFCSDLSTPGLSEIGYARAGESLWVIVAEPMAGRTSAERQRAGQDILRVVNDARARGRRCGAVHYQPAPPVEFSAMLSDVALAHSREMAATERLEHEGRDGSDAAARVHRANLSAKHVGENIAAGVPTGAEVIAGWLASTSHCSVIMDPRFTKMGVGYVVEPHSHSVVYWTQLFTEPR
jgi:uncharacterized protein YkwD